jgi:hypothetical protein
VDGAAVEGEEGGEVGEGRQRWRLGWWRAGKGTASHIY